MTKLTDLQLILLTNASQRADGSLLPAPALVGDPGDRLRKAIAALLKRGLVQESDTSSNDAIWREEDERRIAVLITSAGREAIGATDDDTLGDTNPVSGTTPAAKVTVDGPAEVNGPTTAMAAPLKAGSKQALIIDLLTQGTGATLKDLEAATGWLPHTTRAALTGLRKKGHTITKTKVNGVNRCSMVASAQ